MVVILETKRIPTSLFNNGRPECASWYDAYPLFFHISWFFLFFFLFLKSLNTLDLKKKNYILRINPELLFRAAKAFSVSICYLKFMNIWWNEALGCWRVNAQEENKDLNVITNALP